LIFASLHSLKNLHTFENPFNNHYNLNVEPNIKNNDKTKNNSHNIIKTIFVKPILQDNNPSNMNNKTAILKSQHFLKNTNNNLLDQQARDLHKNLVINSMQEDPQSTLQNSNIISKVH
jgi:hypothetical protein